jgi:hypothetical protein
MRHAKLEQTISSQVALAAQHQQQQHLIAVAAAVVDKLQLVM